MKIKVEGNMAKVFTPYNADFVAKIKTIDGRKWDADEKCWTVPALKVDKVREFMIDVYGESDIEKTNKIDLRIKFEKQMSQEDEFKIFGKTVAKTIAYKNVTEGECAVFEVGQPIAEGKRKRPLVTIPSGAVVRLIDVSEISYKKNIEKGVNGYTVEVVKNNSHEIDKDSLLKEKERILARLAEIEKLLSE